PQDAGMGWETDRRRGMGEVVGHEAAALALEPDGRVRCAPSSPSQGQGHGTALAQLVADHVGVPLERVVVAPVDTSAAPAGGGTFASRSAVSFAGAVPAAAERLRRKILAVAAGLVEASADDLVLEAGVVRVGGVPERRVSFAEGAAVPLGGEGQLLTATLMDYALPVASSVPSLELDHLETPSPLTPGGVKGMGEGGTIGAPAAIANAVADAVRGLGIRVTALPILPRDLRAP